MSTQIRQSKGTSVGGQFAGQKRAEADSSLDVPVALDFDGPLERLSLQGYNYTVQHFTQLFGADDQFDLSPEYQRGSVWGTERRQNLVRSVFLGIPIGVIVLNLRGVTLAQPYGVIDGKQRIEALRAFDNDEFPIPVSWLEDEFLADSINNHIDVPGWPVKGVFYSGTSRKFKTKWGMKLISSVVAQVGSVEEEAEIFRLINSGGVEQTADTLGRAAAVENRSTDK